MTLFFNTLNHLLLNPFSGEEDGLSEFSEWTICFFAISVEGNRKPEIWIANFDTEEVNMLFKSEETATETDSVIPMAVIDNNIDS